MKKPFAGVSIKWLIYLGISVATLIVWWMVRDQKTVGILLTVAGFLVVAYILYKSVFKLASDERDRIFVALILISIQVLFWALFEQAGSSRNVFADENVDRTLFGALIPASVFQSLNSFYILLLGPLVASMWVYLAKRQIEPTAPQKFALGVIQLGLGFLVLVWGSNADDSLTPVIFLFLIYLLHTMGELCLSPVGLSAMTRLSVPSMVGLIMGTWFLASGAGNFVAALIAQATGSGAIEETTDKAMVLGVYSNIGWLAVAAGMAVFVIAPLLNRMMHLDSLRDDRS